MKRKEIEIQCTLCNKNFFRKFSYPYEIPKRTYCSQECKKKDKTWVATWTEDRRQQQSLRNSGEGNPNFNNKWDQNQRDNQSKIMVDWFRCPEARYKAGSSNRDKKFSPERIHAMHAHRSKESYSHTHSEESKLLIGIKSKEKWTTEYKESHRRKMEESGYWVPLKDINPYKLYFKESNWVESMFSYMNEDTISEISRNGIFSYKNSNGLVRDHIVSRKIGWEFSLPPTILRHPCNLEVVSHAENIRRGHLDKQKTLEEKTHSINLLLNKILCYNNEWKEQKLCLTFIKEGGGSMSKIFVTSDLHFRAL